MKKILLNLFITASLIIILIHMGCTPTQASMPIREISDANVLIECIYSDKDAKHALYSTIYHVQESTGSKDAYHNLITALYLIENKRLALSFVVDTKSIKSAVNRCNKEMRG